jgi:hypothetical protein
MHLSALVFESRLERAKEHVHKSSAEACVVALEVAVVHGQRVRGETRLRLRALHVVEVVRLEMVLFNKSHARLHRRAEAGRLTEAGVAGAGGEEQVDTVPKEVKRGAAQRQARQYAGKVIEVLNGVHGQTGERLDIGVAVMQRVYEGEQGHEVEHAV